MIKFAFRGYCTGHVVLNDLEFVSMIGWKVEIQRVAVVKFRLHNRCCNDAGSIEV